MMRRDRFDALAPALSTDGFKILLDIVITGRGALRIAEQPYRFAARQYGESKLDARVVLDFFGLLLAKLTGNAISPRFLTFSHRRQHWVSLCIWPCCGWPVRPGWNSLRHRPRP